MCIFADTEPNSDVLIKPNSSAHKTQLGHARMNCYRVMTPHRFTCYNVQVATMAPSIPNQRKKVYKFAGKIVGRSSFYEKKAAVSAP